MMTSPRSRSMAMIQTIGLIAASGAAFGTASAAQWPMGYRMGAAMVAIVLVVLAFGLPSIVRVTAKRLENSAPVAAERLRRLVDGEHTQSVKLIVLIIAGLLVVASFVGCVLSGNAAFPWWLATGAVSLAFALAYVAAKSCPKESRRKILLLSVAGYLTSLSANFVAGALTPGAAVTEATLLALGRKIDRIEAKVEQVDETTQRVEKTTEVIASKQTDHDQKLDRLLKHMEEIKLLGIDPTTQPISPEVRAAAEALSTSKDGRERALAAIARRDFVTADKELAALRASPVLEEAFKFHMLEGDRLHAEGKFDEAISPYRAARSARPADVNAHFSLAAALVSASRERSTGSVRRSSLLAEAESTLNDALALPALLPEHRARATYFLGVFFARYREGARAKNIERAIQYFSEVQPFYTTYAWGMHLAEVIEAIATAHFIYWQETANSASLEESMNFFRQAIDEFGKRSGAMRARFGLAQALAEQAQAFGGERRCPLVRESLALLKATDAFYTPETAPEDDVRSLTFLTLHAMLYHHWGCHTGAGGVPFDDIPPAE